MERSALTACPNSKRKAADAVLDEGRLSTGDSDDVAVDAGTPGPAEIKAAPEPQASAPAQTPEAAGEDDHVAGVDRLHPGRRDPAPAVQRAAPP